ncbi:hypothetical protein C7H85_15765 [Zobellella endophytica]|uniref:DUF3360 domain-containing protein n=1 Tax=Zobellella endophytica TaxID=2116700 RepID=A0A2P7R0H9_9GAMM|nr:DUF3360 family protein [Zobellella endophytica]PSJ43703.1 hypothetical protein C7H85_15765 [Zobellella endophytica]
MSEAPFQTYRSQRKPRRSFDSRAAYLEHELSIMSPRRWRINLPFRDYRFELEDLVPALAATIGKIVMVAAVVAAFAGPLGLSNEFVVENVRFEMLIAALLFVILFSGLINPNANLAGTHGPMIPLIPLIVASGGHPLALGLMVGMFGLLLSVSKGGSKLMALTSDGVRGGLLIYLGAMGLLSQVKALNAWATGIDMGYVAFAVILSTIIMYALLARLEMRWLSIPLGSGIAFVIAIVLGAPFEFVTEPGIPHLSPGYWWGETTGWQMGWPELHHFVSVIPFAVLAVAMWSPDFMGHRVFQELNYPKKADKVLMNVDDTMGVASVRQAVGSVLGGGNLASSWGTYMIPAAIAKRPIPAGAVLTGLFCVIAALWGYPMDLAVWDPVLRVALIVGVFMPLLEAGMQMTRNTTSSQSAGIVVFASAFVNPVFGWSLTMLLDNLGLIGDKERGKKLRLMDRWVIPGITFAVLLVIMAMVGMLPGIPALMKIS